MLCTGSAMMLTAALAVDGACVRDQDLFEDVVGKVSEPLRELSLSKRDTCSLFVAMMHSLSAVPLLADKVAPVR